MRFDHVFWDYDGTLFDTYPRIVRAFRKSLRALGAEEDPDALLSLAKVSLRHLVEKMAGKHGVSAAQIRDHYRFFAAEEGYDTLRPYEGAPSLLRTIVAGGGRNYLYTHSGRETLQALEQHGLKGYFADFVTAEDGFASKPAPDALLHLMEKHRLPPLRCVMLGDRDLDVLAGLNAGMAGVLFDPDGFYDAFPSAYRFRAMGEIERAFFHAAEND